MTALFALLTILFAVGSVLALIGAVADLLSCRARRRAIGIRLDRRYVR